MNSRRVEHTGLGWQGQVPPLCAMGDTQDSFLHATKSGARSLSPNGLHWLRQLNHWGCVFLHTWLDPHSSDETSLSVYWTYIRAGSVLHRLSPHNTIAARAF